MRLSLCLVVAFLALSLSACGGGGADAAAFDSGPVSKLDGTILDIDGDSDQRAGVSLTLVETGEVVTSNADGAFTFTALPEGDVTLAFADAPGVGKPSALQEASDADAAEREDDAADGEKDDAGDDSERGDRWVRIRRIRLGESLRIEIRIVAGRIVHVRVIRPEIDHPTDDPCAGERELELAMHRSRLNDDPDMEGELEMSLECNGDQEFEVEVEDATTGNLLEAVVISPDLEEHSLGWRAVELDGDAEWKLDTGDGDALPFGVRHLGRLENHGVVVRDEEGTILLFVRIPELPPYDETCGRVRGISRLHSNVEGAYGVSVLRAAYCIADEILTIERQVFLMGARGLEPGTNVAFYVQHPRTDEMARVGRAKVDRGGSVVIVFDTMKGDDLPFGVATIRGLMDLRVQLRVAETGRVLLYGKTPARVR